MDLVIFVMSKKYFFKRIYSKKNCGKTNIKSIYYNCRTNCHIVLKKSKITEQNCFTLRNNSTIL